MAKSSAFPTERIPFEEAISEPKLLKGYFDGLSVPQRVALKAFYGLPLSQEELSYWAMFHQNCTHDELGYVTATTPTPYTPKEYSQAWTMWGRRSGKTNKFTAPILVYEAALGGHMQYAAKGQDVICYLVAQNLGVAQSHFGFLREVINSSPLISKLVANDLATGITLANGIQLRPASPSVKSQRGMAIPVVAMDEIGFWYTDPDAANPDVEVVRALSWAQAQFPHRKRLGTTTPWNKEGLAWKYQQAGTEGYRLKGEDVTEYRDVLVLHSTTAGIENPRIDRRFLEQERASDPESFERESLARFVDSISGFLSPSLLREAVDAGVTERAPLPRPGKPQDPTPLYIAAIDPAFRKDSFAFTIVHHAEEGIVQDYVEEFIPFPGTPLDPVVVLDSILPTLQRYKVLTVYTDQYQFESLQQLASQRQIYLENVDFTGRSKAKILGSLQQLLNTKRLKLLDPRVNRHADAQAQQLRGLERKLTANGTVQIAAPQGRKDDLAMVLALACYKAIWQLASGPVEEVEKPPTVHERCLATIEKRKREAAGDDLY